MKKNLYLWHSWGALIACIPLLLISLTGSILVFKPEIDRLLQPALETVNIQQGERRLPLDTLYDNIKAEHKDFDLGSWELFDNGFQADRLYLIRRGTDQWHKAHLNPYSGELLNTPVAMDHYLTDWLLDLHEKLLLKDTGVLIAAFSAIIMTFLGVSGLILYRNLYANFFRNIFKSFRDIRWHKRRQLWLIDLHKWIGALASPVLLILGITGGYWNIAHYLHELEEHADGAEHYKSQGPLLSKDISLDDKYQESINTIDGLHITYLVMPFEPERGLTFFGKVPGNNIVTEAVASKYASTVTYDRDSGAIKQASDIRNAGVGLQILDSFRELHFGSFGGMISRVLWCILGLSPVLLSITGLYVWLGRKIARRKPARKKQRIPKTAA